MGLSPEKQGKPLLRVLAGETLALPPVWLMRQAGRYLPEYRALRQRVPGFLDLCFSPALASEATLQPVRRFGLDAVILFSDILVVAHGLGQSVGFREGEGPVLTPIRSVEAVQGLSLDGFAGRVAPVRETVARVAASLPAQTALIGFAGAPWTMACYMVEGGGSRDFAAVKGWAFADPEGFGTLIDRVTEATILYLAGQIAAGAEVVQLFDSWAGILPEAAFRRWVIAPTRRIVAALKQTHPHVPVIGFPRGAGLMYRAYFSESSVDALGLDSAVPVEIARKTLQSIGPVQGNLDPLLLAAGGAAMMESVTAIRRALGGGPFVFNLGHGIVPETPVEHVAALVTALRQPLVLP
ncbi:MAG TPA: uroporphyrinogen decarboxylase [Stellaceae bacterium]|nr:uroporphyrinogen decarboxylase [Stellaceae bacterium]